MLSFWEVYFGGELPSMDTATAKAAVGVYGGAVQALPEDADYAILGGKVSADLSQATFS